MKITAGTELQNGKYLVNHVLGQGSLSVTIQATQSRLQQPVVLQTLKLNAQLKADAPALKQRFIAEVQRFAQCHHPGLVRVLDLFEESGLPFVVMDYTPGQTLAELVFLRGPLPESVAVSYIQQVGSALAAMHRHGLVHRDLTPQTVIRPPESSIVVVVNPGLAHPSALEVSIEGSAPLSEYAALEQHQSPRSLTPASDVYSLAATLYFLVTGHSPVAAPLRLHSPLPAPRQFQPNLSLSLESAILQGLELDRQSRPATIAAWFSLLSPEETLPAVNLNELATHPGSPSSNGHTAIGQATTVIQEASSVPLSAPPAVYPSDAGVSLAPINLPAEMRWEPPAEPAVQPDQAISPDSHPLPSPSNQATVAANPSIRRDQSAKRSPIPTPYPQRRFPRRLIVASIAAVSMGVGFGLIFRIVGASAPGSSFFHTEQAFPPIKDWPQSKTPEPDIPSEPLITAPARQEIAPDPVAPPPTIRQYEAAPEPEPEPAPVPDEAVPAPVPALTPEASPLPTSAPAPTEPPSVPAEPIPAQPEVAPPPPDVPQPSGSSNLGNSSPVDPELGNITPAEERDNR